MLKSHALIRAMALVLLCWLVATPDVARAQEPRPAIIIFLDFERLFIDSAVAKDIQRQLREQIDKVSAEASAANEDLSRRIRDLDQQRTIMTPEALQDRATELQAERRRSQQDFARRTQSIEAGAIKARRDVEAALRPIFAEILQKKGADLLLDQNSILVGNVGLDVTEEAIALLNQRLPKLELVPQKIEAPQ